MTWLQFWLWVASFVISDYFRERLPSQTPSGIGDFNIPTATEGRVVPIIPGGTVRVDAPNCIWYGLFVAVERTVTTGIIFREDETIGFTYELALQYALAKTQVAGITGVWISDDQVFDFVTDAAGIPQAFVDIDRDDLFGGVGSGGGFVGRIRLHDGADDQAVSAFLQNVVGLDPLPAYRGTSYIMITDLTETRGANIGESNNLRYIRVEVQAFDAIANTGLGDRLGLANDRHFIGPDANPISVAYELYLNERWGRNFPVSDVDIASFQAAAEICWSEGIGYTQLIDELILTGDLQDTIEQHIDGYIGPNPITGRIEVTLSRPDYILANEFQTSDDNIVSVKKWNKGDWSQTFNRVRIRYSDRAKQWNESHAIELAPGNRIIQGRTVTKELRYQGCHTASVAQILAARGKRTLSLPQSSGTVVLDRTAWQIRPGSVLSFTSSQAEETDLAVRVTKAGLGDGIGNAVECEIVADLSGNEVATVAAPPPTDFVPPVQIAVAFAIADQAALEAPFILMRYDASQNSVPRIATLARRAPGNSPIEYEVIRRTRVPPTAFAGGYTSTDVVRAGFATVGELRAVLTGWQSGNGTFSFAVDPIGAESLDGLIATYAPSENNAAGVAVISPGLDTEEWIAFDAVVDDGGGIQLQGVFRACMDTAMEAHAIGARVWFIWTGSLGIGSEIYTAGNGVDIKLLPTTPNDAVLEPAATSLPEVSLLATTPRNGRPLLPVNLLLNGTSFETGNVDFDAAVTGGPGLEITPTHRLWSVADIISSVSGLDALGGELGADDLADQSLRVSLWIYDLDTDPVPVRGDSLVTIIDQAVVNQDDVMLITRAALITAGIAVNFAARIEIETKHSPVGQAANQISRVPQFFDFAAIGTWV